MVHTIIMPPQHIIIGTPAFIMVVIFWQHSMMASFMDASIGWISQVMPLAVIVQVIFAIIIGIIPPMGIMPFMGIMPPIGIAIIMDVGIIDIWGIIGIIAGIGIAFMFGSGR